MKILCVLLGIVLFQPVVASEEFTKEGKITLQKRVLGDGKTPFIAYETPPEK